MGPHKFDKSNLRQVILDAPKQFSVGFDLARDIKIQGKFDRVVFFGEGGSAFPAAFIRILIANKRYEAGQLPIPFMQNYTYNLTPDSFEGALNVFCSYSGNTEETISTLKQAIDKGLPAVVMASGGKVEEISRQNSVPFVKLPLPFAGFQPRMGTGYFVGVMLGVLTNSGMTVDFRDEILKSAEGFAAKMDDLEKKGQELAAKISGKTPLVWANQMYKELARVWTIKFNEHAKNPAFWNFFSELNHNLMVGMTNLSDRYFAVMLKDPADDPRNLRRYEITADLLSEYGMESETIEIVGASVFEKIFNSVYLADFAAYYLAEKNKVDPTPVDAVEEFKKRLNPNFDKKFS
ncbi:MAG: SIS domain-containing protein [Candidatus Curtissbacteria bacterium]|nr:SIS domain-containing protein [Candidatus Curtissbacteria bacterium]